MKYEVGIIGAGNISCNYDNPDDALILTHAHAIKMSKEFNIAGFYDVNLEAANDAKDKWGGTVFGSIDEVCGNSDIICVCVPDAFHYEILKQCIKYDNLKAIIAEKPITKEVEQADEIEEIFNQLKMPIFVNYSRRYSKGFDRIKEWIENKAGVFIFGNFNYGKGVVHNASHFVNLLQYYFDNLEVENIIRVYHDFYKDDPSVSFLLDVKGAPIYFNAIPCNFVTEAGFELLFEKGKVRYIGGDECIEYYEVGESSIYEGEKNYILWRKENIDAGSTMAGLYKNVFDVLSGDGQIKCTISDATETLKLCEKIRRKVIV